MQKSITIKQARVDMILTQSVKDPQGRILASEGTRLTEKLIKSLKKRGCEKITVESQGNLSQYQYDALIKKLDKRFIKIEKNSWLQIVYQNLLSDYKSRLS